MRQKWTDRNSTSTNGRASTWSTYHRKSVSGFTWMPPSRMNFAWFAMSGEFPEMPSAIVTAQSESWSQGSR